MTIKRFLKWSMSPRFLARMAAVLGVLEGVASVNGQVRIPDRLVVTTDAAATAANILGNESLFRLGLALCVLANYLYPCNLALGGGELVLGFWLLVLGVNVERWKEQASLGR